MTAHQTQRLQFLEGAALEARDLQDDFEFAGRLRGLHVRALHGVWGIARGYAVHTSRDRTAILVGPGIAYDCHGREIISGRSLVLSLPSIPPGAANPDHRHWFDLAIRFDPDLDPDGCTWPDPGRAEERPLWRWIFAGSTATKEPVPELADRMRLGEEIPLARVALRAKGEFVLLDLTLRRNARAITRPHIGTGFVARRSAVVPGNFMEWSIEIDTSSAGFTQTPEYFASLDQHPVAAAIEMGAAGMWEPVDLFRQILGPFLSISDPTPSSFRLEVRMAMPPSNLLTLANVEGIPSMMAEFIRLPVLRLPVGINWFGVEPVEGCQPVISFQTLNWLSGSLFINAELAFRNLLLNPNVTNLTT